MRVRLNLRSMLMLLAVAAAVVTVILVSRSENMPFTTSGGGPNGLRGMALLLEELGYDVVTGPRVVPELSAEQGDEGPGVMMVSLPHVYVDEDDLLALEAWAQQGNTVLFLGWSSRLTMTLATRYRLAPVVSPLAKAGTVFVESSGGMESVRTLELSDGSRFYAAGDESHVLVSGEDGAVVVQIDHGDGRFLFIADGRLHTNRQISKAQNIDLLVLALRTSQANRIYFVEPGAAPPPAPGQPFPIGAAVRTHLFAAVIVALWAVGRRLGPPRTVPAEHDELSMIDYIRGVAGLYQRGHARTYALQILYDEFMSMVASQLPGPVRGQGPHDKALQLARRRGVDEEALKSCLERCEQALQADPSDSDLVELAGELEGFRRRLVRSRT